MIEIPRPILARWAASKPTISALYVFGSYARGEARPDSDLDIALALTNVDDPLSELIANAPAWEAELSKLTGVVVKDTYLATDATAQGPRVEVFRRTAA